MPGIVKDVQVYAPLEQVWAAITDPAIIRGWMGPDSTVEVDFREGGGFRLFGGATTGVYTRIVAPNRLEHTWRQAEWPEAWAASRVAWELRAAPNGRGTRIHLVHDELPNDQERDSHAEGWELYFLGPIKAWLEAQTPV